jgi:hypothetical protein
MYKARNILLTAAMLAICVPAGFSATVLNDWCFNINGAAVTTNACNGGGTLPSTVNGSAFDFTLSPGSNKLGSVSITLGSASNQFVLAYMDYDLDFSAHGSFDDHATTVGPRPPGVSYQLSDPNTSTIFSQFASNALSNTDTVATGGLPPNQCCDVAWALGLSGINGPGTVTFTVSTTAPGAGVFYLQQTNNDLGDSIYLSETFTPGIGPPPGSPEPSTWTLVFPAAIALILWKCKKKAV